MTRALAFISEKGGSCKTTLAVNTAAYLAHELGERVLLVDVDPQGQAGKCLGIDVANLGVTLFEVLAHGKDPRLAVVETGMENLKVLPSNKRLASLPQDAALDPKADRRLAEATAKLSGEYDYVVFDSPPSLGLLSTSVMLAAHELLVPVPLTFLAMDGCAEIMETAGQVAKRTRHDVTVELMIPTLYRPTKLADEILAKLRGHFGARVAKTVVGYSVKVDEAQSHGKTIWEYAPRSPGAVAMESLAKEIVRLGKKRTASLLPATA